MTIRASSDADIPEIVDLLKISLGESLMPKSETYWRWKHIDNPFGKSPVLLAEEDGKIIGVRAFMCWQWKKGNQSIKSVRAVDTATHPDYQGKGIFKKLTLSLLDECKKDGVHLVFNTPNQKSKPGYIKMGWEEAGKLPVHVKVVRPFSAILNILRPNREANSTNTSHDKSIEFFLNHPDLPALIQSNEQLTKHCINTLHTVESLRWRYQHVPVVSYHAAGLEENGLKGLIIFRIKSTRLGKEMRLTDFFIDTMERRLNLWDVVKRQALLHKADYITLGGSGTINVIAKGLSLSNQKIGPAVTVRDVSIGDLGAFKGFKQWCPSLGDLELF